MDLGGGVVVDPGDDAAAALALGVPEWAITRRIGIPTMPAPCMHCRLPERGWRWRRGRRRRLRHGGPDAGRLHWLRQPIERYRVDRSLDEGEVVRPGPAFGG